MDKRTNGWKTLLHNDSGEVTVHYVIILNNAQPGNEDKEIRERQ